MIKLSTSMLQEFCLLLRNAVNIATKKPRVLNLHWTQKKKKNENKLKRNKTRRGAGNTKIVANQSTGRL